MSENASPLRVGVLGDDALARQMVDALERRTPGALLVAITNEGSTPNPFALLRAQGADAVCIAGPSGERASAIHDALEAGMHVCCPLPVASDLSTLDSLILRTTAAPDLIAYAPNPLRHWLPLSTLYERRKAIGTPISLFAAHRTKRSHVGNLFTDVALPFIDLAVWLVQSAVERVQVMAECLFTSVDAAGPEAADTALILLRFANDVVATLEVARSLPETFPQDEEMTVEFMGRDAVLRAAPANQAITVTGAHGAERDDWLPPPAISIVNEFVETIRMGASPPQSLLDARWVLPVLEKVRLAAMTGEMVRVGGAIRR
jgi:predicted dehydrogenase